MIHLDNLSIESRFNFWKFLYHTILISIVITAASFSIANKLALIDVKEDHILLKDYNKIQVKLLKEQREQFISALKSRNPSINFPPDG